MKHMLMPSSIIVLETFHGPDPLTTQPEDVHWEAVTRVQGLKTLLGGPADKSTGGC